ncbi:large ribosomal subunit protein uL3m [Neocloeon triangulifer]|uniref:large ribosomal subunit protein uL3m n=1 Tax=Neocloeon triangulifer TaxID=2078957 RepID=UPI00286ED90D|nr:large ribosomal subunit protein uL3m [Neocloeon triangulifer]
MNSLNSMRILLGSSTLRKSAPSPLVQQMRHKKNFPLTPKIQNPIWFPKKERASFDEGLTKENQAFVKEMVYRRFGPPAIINGVETFDQSRSVLKQEPVVAGEWAPGVRRTGLIARNIGVYPMWMKDGTKIATTLLQVVDNHVIKYIPPELFIDSRKAPRRYKNAGKWGCLVVGAESGDPQKFTKEYCGLFKDSGIAPTKLLTRFLVSPQAAIQPGTPLSPLHFQVGDRIDVFGRTKERGFQGVMKRWGFKGMPASHGVTKTHRRGGNIGAGGNKGRVFPGTKMPGFMGGRRRTIRGCEIVRINTKYNVIFVRGQAIPGGQNGIVFLHDTLLPLKWHKTSPKAFPTYFPQTQEEAPLADIYHQDLHNFAAPSILYEDDEKPDEKKKK